MRFLPLRSDRGVARRLVQAAAAARARQDHRAAAAFYEESSRYRPEHAGLHVQAGHMFKEAGALAAAEAHYLRARAMLPDDAELALQLGHFYKVSGRPDEAEAAYDRALALRPGWADPAGELARLRAVPRGEMAAEGIVPALLPRPAPARGVASEGVHIHRLGIRAQPTPWGDLKRMRGIEAVRGFCLSAKPLTTLRILIDDVELHSEPLTETGAGGVAKYPFNAWIDVDAITPGAHRIDLQFTGPSGIVRTHRETIAIVAPSPAPNSDACVMPPPGAGTIEQRIADLPSIARPAARAVFAGPIKTVLVQRADQLGDLACSVPAILRLRALLPEARLIGLVTPANHGLAEALGLFDETIVVTFEASAEGHRALSAGAQGRLRATLAARAIDLAIDLGQSPDSRPLLLLSGARLLYGFADPASPWLDAGFALGAHDPVNRLDIVPPARKLLALIEGLATMLGDAPRPPLLHAPDPALLARHGIAPDERFIVVHAGARLSWTRWPHFHALTDLLIAHTDLRIVLLGEAEEASDGRLYVVPETLPFPEFDALLSACALFIGNDSGPKHLAALRGAPVISLHMARLNWNEWGQEGGGTIISRHVPCAGCAITAPEDCAKQIACLRDIAPREVLAEALRLLGA